VFHLLCQPNCCSWYTSANHKRPQLPLVVPSPNSLESYSAPTVPSSVSHILDIPIALRKGIQPYCNPNPLYAFSLDYNCLSPSYFSFVYSLDYVFIPKSIGEVMADPRMYQTMLEEMTSLDTSDT